MEVITNKLPRPEFAGGISGGIAAPVVPTSPLHTEDWAVQQLRHGEEASCMLLGSSFSSLV